MLGKLAPLVLGHLDNHYVLTIAPHMHLPKCDLKVDEKRCEQSRKP
jgi:hypothetical protein